MTDSLFVQRQKESALTASIAVEITLEWGPAIADSDHVYMWLANSFPSGRMGGFTFKVCPRCFDPDECDCLMDMSVYRVLFLHVDALDPAET